MAPSSRIYLELAMESAVFLIRIERAALHQSAGLMTMLLCDNFYRDRSEGFACNGCCCMHAHCAYDAV